MMAAGMLLSYWAVDTTVRLAQSLLGDALVAAALLGAILALVDMARERKSK